MSNAQRPASETIEVGLTECGLVRFEVLGRETDRELIRSIAQHLARDDADASRLRSAMHEAIGGEPPRKGDILAALRRSPLVGADIELSRPRGERRGVGL